MTDAEQIDALRRLAIKQPRISVTRAMRLIRERERRDATTERLRAEIRLEQGVKRDHARLRELAGYSEGLV